MTQPDHRQCADELIGPNGLLKIQALNIAASHRREAFIFNRKTDEEPAEYDGELGRQVLADAKVYHAWLTEADGAA